MQILLLRIYDLAMCQLDWFVSKVQVGTEEDNPFEKNAINREKPELDSSMHHSKKQKQEQEH